MMFVISLLLRYRVFQQFVWALCTSTKEETVDTTIFEKKSIQSLSPLTLLPIQVLLLLPTVANVDEDDDNNWYYIIKADSDLAENVSRCSYKKS